MKVLACGAGQQSSALTLMSCDNILHPGKFPLVPIYDAVLYCDLGGEREWVYRQVHFLKEQCRRLGIPFYILGRRNLKEDYMKHYGISRVSTIPFWSLGENGKKGRMRRQCTIDYKVVQMQQFVRWELLGYKKGEKTRPEDVGAHEMHIGFTYEEKQRIFDSQHIMFTNHFPMVEMGLVRADNYAYTKETWGLETRGSACLFCPFHSNYFFWHCMETCKKDYQTVLDFDELLEHGVPNARIGVPDNQIFISKSRKRIRDLEIDECQDMETFQYGDRTIWNGF